MHPSGQQPQIRYFTTQLATMPSRPGLNPSEVTRRSEESKKDSNFLKHKLNIAQLFRSYDSAFKLNAKPVGTGLLGLFLMKIKNYYTWSTVVNNVNFDAYDRPLNL